MAFCSKCGSKIEEGSIFCTSCGNKVDGGIPAVQSGSQSAMLPIQGIPQNSTTNTANKTASCQGCLCNYKGKKCNYYGCTISEAEKYDCGMRGISELQKKQNNNNIILRIVLFAISALSGWPLGWLFGWLGVLTGISFSISIWLGLSFDGLFIGLIYYFAISYRNKKRRENAKRL